MLDIKMPGMDGIDLLKILHRTFPGIRVILVSGYDEFEYAQEAVSARAFCYILKPEDAEVLLRRAAEARDEILAERRRLAEDAELRAWGRRLSTMPGR